MSWILRPNLRGFAAAPIMIQHLFFVAGWTNLHPSTPPPPPPHTHMQGRQASLLQVPRDVMNRYTRWRPSRCSCVTVSCLSVCLSLTVCLFHFVSVSVSVCLLPHCLSLTVSVCVPLSVCLPVRPSVSLYVCRSLSVSPFVCLSLFVCLPACLTVCLSVCFTVLQRKRDLSSPWIFFPLSPSLSPL